MRLDDNEDIEVELVPLSRISTLIRDGSIDHALVIAAFHFYFAQPEGQQTDTRRSST
jgi:ADP-ribose pyrophosphatase